MFRIARIRLAGVGPTDARFDKPSPEAAPFEISCIGADDTPDDSVIWLENGGGKTVLLALLFHVLRPDKAAQIGNDDQGGRRADITDFVLPGDVAHVVCEWVAADSDERILTGLVAERKGAGVNRTWYLAAVRDGALSLDDLVFDIDSRRVPAARYVESLEERAATAGKSGRRNRIDFTKTHVQKTWREMLADNDLDPALFEYQVRMNRSEGGATSLFRFVSAEAFVQFFLELTMNPDTVAAVSDELVRVANKVASLPRKELELAHATGAVGRLTTLAEKWSAFTAADRAKAAAQRQAERLHDQLTAAVSRAADELDHAEQRLEEADLERAERDRLRREADTRAKTVAIALADARVAAITAEKREQEKLTRDVSLTAAAWPRVTLHQRRSGLDAQLNELRAALDVAERDAAPLRERRDRLLRALRREFQRLADLAGGDVRQADGAFETAEEQANEADQALRHAEGRIREIDGLLKGLTAQVERHQRALERAVADGILHRGNDIDATLSAARDESAAAAAEIGRITDERRQLAAELPDLRQQAKTTNEAAGNSERAASDQRAAVAAAAAEREALEQHQLLAELGEEESDLEIVGADVLTRVVAEADRLRANAVAAEAATAEDRRAADSLERDRLLPPRADVEAICQTLQAAGVDSATAGWRYLEAVPTSARAAAIAAHPALVDGVVVASHDFDRARDILADVAPSAAILVGIGATLTEPSPTPTVGWVVPPTPAMHDRGSAETEFERRRERLDTAADQASVIAHAEREARDLASGLEAHLSGWPPGTLPAAVTLADELDDQAVTAREEAIKATDTLDAAETLLDESGDALDQQRRRRNAADNRVGRLQQLAESAGHASEAMQEKAVLSEEQGHLTTQAETAADQRRAAQIAAETARAKKATAERAWETATQQLARLPDPGDGPVAARNDAASLGAAYDSAVELVNEATTDSELARSIRRLEGEHRDVENDWTALTPAMRERTEQLAASPAATDAAVRRRAEADASAAAAQANEALAEIGSRLGIATSERQALPAPEPTWAVEPFPIPDDLPELEALSTRLNNAFETARERAAQIREVLSELTRARDAAKAAHTALDVQATSLSSVVGDREPQLAGQFEGDAAAAVKEALRRITEATRLREQADSLWRQAAHAVGAFARDDRWKALTGELARRLRDDQPEHLANAADALLTQTRILESRLREDIAHLDTHRQMLINSLGDAVSEAARSLRSARRKSELPEGLGDWSRHPFLKIGVDLARDRAELDGRLRRFTNDLLERAASGASLPTNADLVCQAVLACTDRSVTVEVLKPNKAQRLRYVPITEAATLSGGMRATAAIAMFCTLAKVRAANRTGRIGVGTLVLDNPLGDANATFLVALQRLVARKNDVQLIYTTGVNDMDALRLFPVVTRLTNESAKRSHLAYVVADEAFLKRLEPSAGDNAIVTGTRLVRRRQPLLRADIAAMTSDEDDER